jgi:predicted O-linked N-acetylglucosamine transferase (SPINDLY family)
MDSDTLTVAEAFRQGGAFYESGQLQQAELLYRAILRVQPTHAGANHNMGIIALQTGNPVASLPYFRAALAADPDRGQYWHSLVGALIAAGEHTAAWQALLDCKGMGLGGGVLESLETLLETTRAQGTCASLQEQNALVAHFEAGRYDEAECIARQCITRYPDEAFGWKSLGTILTRLKRNDEAVPVLTHVIASFPGDPDTCCALGNALQALGRPSEAMIHYERAIELDPASYEAHNNLGAALQGLGHPDEAVTHYIQAIALKPDVAEAYNNLGSALVALGRLDEAVAPYQRTIELKPDVAAAHNDLGNLLQRLGRSNQAVAQYEKALALAPEYAEAHNNRGNALTDLGRLDAAMKSYARAIELRPDFAEAHNNRGNALTDLGRLDAAMESYARAIELRPDFAEAYNNLGNALQKFGRPDEAVAQYAKALACRPHYAEARSNMLFTLAHQGGVSPESYLTQAKNWERAVLTDAARHAAAAVTFQRAPASGRRLKIGYVSGDFRQHAVGRLIEQLITAHDRERFAIHAYPTCLQADALTYRLKQQTDQWTPIAGLTDAAAAERIRQDGIDVLVDLSGHTSHNRLQVFALRAAPVQAHYLGYFASTGLSAMDYFLSDASVVPADEDERYSEKIWRLPRLWLNYQPGDAAPPSAWKPDPSGRLWFGGFNNLSKITPESVALWSRILTVCPEGNLLLKTAEFTSPAIREHVLGAFAAQGIAGERIRLLGKTPDWRQHMALYDRLDVVLDPVGGHCGVTTTCDALWMGAPVITLAGTGMVRRMCAAIMTSLGRTEWIADSPDAYVAKAIRLATDVTARRALRHGQREAMLHSDLCDSQGLAQALEDAYTQMFDAWRDARARRGG